MAESSAGKRHRFITSDPVVVGVNTLLLCMSCFAIWLLLNSSYTLIAHHGGICFSYPCEPNYIATAFMVLVTAILTALNVYTGARSAKRIYAVFKK